MINECVAKGDYLNYFSKKNITIIHCPLSIVHSLDRASNWNFVVVFSNIFLYNIYIPEIYEEDKL